jgi:D-alanyl-lipoteichoic acid acyltransferase DltB (MBOAT superfamily)
MYSKKPRNFLKEILSIHCFSSSNPERPCHCCKKEFKHNNDISFRSSSENFFIKGYELKNDTKRFQSD